MRRKGFHHETCEGRILGDDTFVDEVMRQSHRPRQGQRSLDEILNAVCQACDITEAQLKALGKVRPFTEARALAAALVLESPNLSLTKLGRRLERDVAALGRAGRRVVAKSNTGTSMIVEHNLL